VSITPVAKLCALTTLETDLLELVISTAFPVGLLPGLSI
jgi:hypothetical protein